MLLQLIIIQITTFLLIVFVLRKLLYTETAKEVKRLKILRDENTRKQGELQQKIDASEKAYGEKIAAAEEEIRGLRRKAEDEVSQEKKKIIGKAKNESEDILKAAFNAKEKIREEAFFHMEKKAPLLASKIFKEILSSEVKKAIHKELVKRVIEEIKQIEKSKFKVKTKMGEIISAYSLEKNEKSQLVSLIFEKIGHKVEFNEKEDKGLTAGVVINLGTLVIDGSLENRLKQVENRK